jgi:aminomethyltransferase
MQLRVVVYSLVGEFMASISEVVRSHPIHPWGPQNPLAQPGIVWYVTDKVTLPLGPAGYPIRYADPGGAFGMIADRHGDPTGICILGDNAAGIAGWTGLSLADQYRAMTKGAGAFPCGSMRYLRVSGPGAGELLDMLTPKDLSRLDVGRAAFVIFTTPWGTVDTEAIVLRTESLEYLVSIGGSTRIPTWMGKAETLQPDATVSDAELSTFNIKGPQQISAMGELVHPDDRSLVLALAPFRIASVRTRTGDRAWITRTTVGTEMWAGPAAITDAWQYMLARPDQFTPCGWDALATFRVECSAMVFGLCPLDMHGGTTLADVGHSHMVRADKASDYVGRPALLAPRQTPYLWLAGVEATNPRTGSARVGDAVHDDDGTVVGYVTTAAYSPSRGGTLGFAHLAPSCRAGCAVYLTDGSRWTVRTLPFN